MCASSAGSAVLVQRGSCPFATKALYLQQAKAAAMLIVNTENSKYLQVCKVMLAAAVLSATRLMCRLHVHGVECDRS